jgi:Na+/proline symporter
MLCLGVVFRGLSRNTSDYFRCGGSMPWWITGSSAWLVTFSAWTFVGAASEVYKSGLKVLLLFYAMIPPLLVVAWITAVRFRRMRVVTWMEAVRERFGPASEQFYTWIKVPVELVKAGVGLMTISVFMAAVFNVPINAVIVVLGITITIVAFAGGAFAVLASDFVQMVLVMTITLIAVVLTLRHPEIGGLTGLIAKVDAEHPAHFQWWLAFRPAVLLGWGFAFTCVKFAELNSMEYSTMYLMPKSEAHARRMVAIPLVGGIVGPLLWVIPPLAATVMFPDLAAVFPNLSKPTEGAFVAVALKVMPIGLIGLLLCAMFGATLTQMDAAVNKYVGVIVRSFYLPVVRPDAPEKHLLRVGKICTLGFGALIIALSLVINTHRSTDVFTLLNQLMVSVGLPLTIPVFLGLFYRHTPGWSGWGTALVGFGYSAWANFGFKAQLAAPDFLARLPAPVRNLLGRPEQALSGAEKADLLLVVTALGTLLVTSVVFFGSALFFGRPAAAADRERAGRFFTNLNTPLRPQEDAGASDEPVYRMLGMLCQVYGGFILLLMFIPNGIVGRLCFLFVGGVMGGAGVVLSVIANRKRAHALRPS